MEKFSWHGRAWIEKDGETFLGCGRVTLLERIREHGSISQAARSMGMGYRHAWRLVDAMNRNAPVPLVITMKGGVKGGGARLTEAGESAIEFFWNFYQRFRKYLDDESEALNHTLRTARETAAVNTDSDSP